MAVAVPKVTIKLALSPDLYTRIVESADTQDITIRKWFEEAAEAKLKLEGPPPETE